MLFGALPHAQNRGFWCSPLCQKSCSRSCFWCSPSCQKSSFLVLSFVYCFPSCKKSCSRSRFLVLSLVHKIVVFGALPCAKNRALDRAFGALLRAKNRPFWCSPSCIAFPRAKNRALDPAFWCSPCSLPVRASYIKIVVFGALVFGALLRDCFPSCKKSCSRSCFLVPFWCSPSCKKSCSRSCFFFGALLRVLLSLVQKIVL